MNRECGDRITPTRFILDMSLKELETWLSMISMCDDCPACESDKRMVERQIARVKDKEEPAD